MWCKVAGIVFGKTFPGDGERLTGRRSGPDRPVVGLSCKTEGVAPPADPGKEVALTKPGKVGWFDFEN